MLIPSLCLDLVQTVQTAPHCIGLLLGNRQWGYNNTTGSATITFPIAFSVACYSVAIGGYLSATGNVIAQQITKTSFKMTGPSPGDAQYARWLAVGK